MKKQTMDTRINACMEACETLMKELRAMCAELSDPKDSSTEQRECLPVFVPNRYVPIAVWLETKEGKAATPMFCRLKTWAERATYLSQIVGWEVDCDQLRRAISRLNWGK